MPLLSTTTYSARPTPHAAPPAAAAGALLAHHPHPIVRLAATGEVYYTNLAAQALGPALALATQPEGPLLPLVRTALHLGTTQHQEVQVGAQWFTLQVVPEPGSPYATLYLTNSDALHHAEERLAQQRDFYEHILNSLSVEVVAFDAAQRCQFVSTRAIPDPAVRAWAIGKTVAEYCAHCQLPPEIAAERLRHFEHACHTRTTAQWQETVACAEETPRHLLRQLQPVVSATGELSLLVSTGIDVTKQHLAQQKLVEQQEFYEFILNKLPCDIGIFDEQLRYVFVNERGISDPDIRKWVIGRDNYAYFERTKRPRAMADERNARLSEAWQKRQLVTYQETFTRPDGDRYQLRCLQPVFWPDGSPRVLVGYGLDMTERVLAERSLTAAKVAAEESARVKEAFLANMSHEIRTPMNAILGMSQLLAKTPLSAEQTNYQQAITASAENLLVIINDILDLSKLEAGKLPLEIINFSPAHLLNQVEQTLRYKAAEKGLGLVIQLAPDVPSVLLGDPYRIRQVILNLADNALKFTQKGSVTVVCQPPPLGPDTPATNTTALEFKVIDTGIGIDADYLGTMFDEFSQADSSVTRRFGGTGLGLSICRDLVRLMGGEIQVSSQKSRGTTISFVLHLPVGQAQAIPRRQLPPAELQSRRQQLRGKRVLLVEDNLFNRQIAKSFMTQAELVVTEAEHGAQAVAQAQQQPFDLVLMDVQMPVMDGYTATTMLRQLGFKMPIIALTANAINGERAKCLAAGMNGYLTKPFQEAQLLQQLYESLAAAPATSAAAEAAPEAAPASLYSIDDLLKAGQGDPEFVVFMLHTFMESCDEAVADLHRALEEADLQLLKTTAHTLKPSLQHLNAWQALPLVQQLNTWPDEFAHAPLHALVCETEDLLYELKTQILLDLEQEAVLTRVLGAPKP